MRQIIYILWLKETFNWRANKMKQIIRNKDEKGIILTYGVVSCGREFQYNTLKQAKIMAWEDE